MLKLVRLSEGIATITLILLICGIPALLQIYVSEIVYEWVTA